MAPFINLEIDEGASGRTRQNVRRETNDQTTLLKGTRTLKEERLIVR